MRPMDSGLSAGISRILSTAEDLSRCRTIAFVHVKIPASLLGARYPAQGLGFCCSSEGLQQAAPLAVWMR